VFVVRDREHRVKYVTLQERAFRRTS